MTGLYVGVAVVALVRFFNTRERRVLLVALLFAIFGLPEGGGLSPRGMLLARVASALLGLVLTWVLAPDPRSRPHAAAPRPREERVGSGASLP